MNSEDDITEFKALIAADSNENLDLNLQRLNQQKLSPMCLLNPKNRDTVDLAISLICEEKKRRRATSD